MAIPIVEDWWITPGDTHSPRPVLQGRIIGDPRFTDGAVVKTSPLVDLDPEAMLARTRHSIYRLGAINPSFQIWLDRECDGLDRYARTIHDANDVAADPNP